MANSFEFIQQRPTIQNALDQSHGLGLDNIAFDTFVDVGDRATIWKTLFSDGILTFESDYKCPFKHIAATIEPVQDLHGYDSPWPAGGRVNKADSSKFTQYASAYGLSFQATSKGFRVYGTVSAGVESIPHSFRTVNINDDTLDLANLRIKAFNLPTGATARLDTSTKTIVIDYWTFGAGDVIDREIDVVIYEGSSAPTEWSPYSNECPISGWTGTDINISGADTSDPTTIPISWQTEAGTVYGGNLAINDDGSCKLTVDRAMVDFGDLDWSLASATFGRWYAVIDNIKQTPDGATPLNAIAEEYKIVTSNAYNNVAGTMYVVPNGTTINVCNGSATDKPKGNLCYELAAPITYTLHSVTMLSSLLGTNNIWASTGGIAVTYKDINPLFLTDPLNVGVMTLK